MKAEFWFVVGSQFLYGPEVLETIEARAGNLSSRMSALRSERESAVLLDPFSN